MIPSVQERKRPRLRFLDDRFHTLRKKEWAYLFIELYIVGHTKALYALGSLLTEKVQVSTPVEGKDVENARKLANQRWKMKYRTEKGEGVNC